MDSTHQFGHLSQWLVIVLSSAFINYSFLYIIGLPQRLFVVMLLTAILMVSLGTALLIKRVQITSLYTKWFLFCGTSFVVYCYLLLPYYFGFFSSFREAIIYVISLIVMTFLSPLISDIKKLINDTVPLATLATIGAALLQLYITKIDVKSEITTISLAIGLASYSGRFLLFTTLLFFLFWIIKEIIERGASKSLYSIFYTPYFLLKIIIPIMFFAGIYLLLKSFLIAVPLDYAKVNY